MTDKGQPPDDGTVDRRLEAIFLERVVLVDDHQTTYKGYPAELMRAIESWADTRAREARERLLLQIAIDLYETADVDSITVEDVWKLHSKYLNEYAELRTPEQEGTAS